MEYKQAVLITYRCTATYNLLEAALSEFAPFVLLYAKNDTELFCICYTITAYIPLFCSAYLRVFCEVLRTVPNLSGLTPRERPEKANKFPKQ